MEAIDHDTEAALVSSTGSHLAEDGDHNRSLRTRVGGHWHGGEAGRAAQP